jgi:hypothetical protein
LEIGEDNEGSLGLALILECLRTEMVKIGVIAASGASLDEANLRVLSEYWAVQPVPLELGCPIHLGQLTHSGQPLLILRILRVVLLLRFEYNL